MKISVSKRMACHPSDVKGYDTDRLREEFLAQNLFETDAITIHYSQYERYLLGGALPINETLQLETIDCIKSNYFCERRELGIVNIGTGVGIVSVDNKEYELAQKEALYVGKGSKVITFKSKESKTPAKFYFSSTPAHKKYPTTLVNKQKANILNLGAKATCNERTIYQLIVPGIVESCQLVMGLTELHEGSVWNTMPSHTHDRRMEAYFYFEVSKGQAVCHLMGEPKETRHLFIHNEEAVFSPEWGIHSGVGTSNYSFVWGMGGENLDYTDMDTVQPNELR